MAVPSMMREFEQQVLNADGPVLLISGPNGGP